MLRKTVVGSSKYTNMKGLIFLGKEGEIISFVLFLIFHQCKNLLNNSTSSLARLNIGRRAFCVGEAEEERKSYKCANTKPLWLKRAREQRAPWGKVWKHTSFIPLNYSILPLCAEADPHCIFWPLHCPVIDSSTVWSYTNMTCCNRLNCVISLWSGHIVWHLSFLSFEFLCFVPSLLYPAPLPIPYLLYYVSGLLCSFLPSNDTLSILFYLNTGSLYINISITHILYTHKQHIYSIHGHITLIVHTKRLFTHAYPHIHKHITHI